MNWSTLSREGDDLDQANHMHDVNAIYQTIGCWFDDRVRSRDMNLAYRRIIVAIWACLFVLGTLLFPAAEAIASVACATAMQVHGVKSEADKGIAVDQTETSLAYSAGDHDQINTPMPDHAGLSYKADCSFHGVVMAAPIDRNAFNGKGIERHIAQGHAFASLTDLADRQILLPPPRI